MIHWPTAAIGLYVGAITAARYVLFAWPPYAIFWGRGEQRFRDKRIQEQPIQRHLIGHELRHSLSTVAVVTLVSTAVIALTRLGWTRIYFEVSERSIGYLAASVIGYALYYDLAFYLSHRFLLHGVLYDRVHAIHHRPTNPTPFSALSFHPVEALVSSLLIYLPAFFVPLHPAALGIVATYVAIINAGGHLGLEFFPRGFVTSGLGRWFNSATHHNMHHEHFHCNYGLGLNVWDRWLRTNHATYDARLAARFAFVAPPSIESQPAAAA